MEYIADKLIEKVKDNQGTYDFELLTDTLVELRPTCEIDGILNCTEFKFNDGSSLIWEGTKLSAFPPTRG